MMQTGEAHFTFPVPYEAGRGAEGEARPRARRCAVDRPALPVDEHAAEALRQPEGAPGDRLRDQQGGARQGRVQRLRDVPAEGVVPQGVEYAVKLGPWPYDVAKAKQLLTEAGYPNGFETELWSAYNHTTAQKVTQFLQQQLQQVGIKAKITLLEAGQRVEKVESWQDPATAPVRLYYVGWSTSTGEADWALRPLLDRRVVAAAALQHRVLQERRGRRRHQAGAARRPTRPRRRSCTGTRRRRSGRTRRGRRSSTERLLSANNKKLSGVACDAGRVVQLQRNRSELTQDSVQARARAIREATVRGVIRNEATLASSVAAPPLTARAMLQYIAKRLLGLLPTLLIVGGAGVPVRPPVARRSGAARRGPGRDARDGRAGAQGPRARQAAARAVRPLRLPASCTGDFGKSLRTKRPVATEIAERFMPTFWLTVVEHGMVGDVRHGHRRRCRRSGATAGPTASA